MMDGTARTCALVVVCSQIVRLRREVSKQARSLARSGRWCCIASILLLITSLVIHTYSITCRERLDWRVVFVKRATPSTKLR